MVVEPRCGEGKGTGPSVVGAVPSRFPGRTTGRLGYARAELHHDRRCRSSHEVAADEQGTDIPREIRVAPDRNPPFKKNDDLRWLLR